MLQQRESTRLILVSCHVVLVNNLPGLVVPILPILQAVGTAVQTPGTCEEIAAFRKRLATRQKQQAHEAQLAYEQAQEKTLARARKKFRLLDADGNGVLSGSELLTLVDWVWDSFHPHG